jgi:hypothetical protein
MKPRFVLFLPVGHTDRCSEIRVNDRAAATQLAFALNVLAIDTADGQPLFSPVL